MNLSGHTDMRHNRLADDLDQILSRTEGVWEELRGKRLFMTGGTGFFGSWLLESFAWANQKLDLDATALVLTRNAAAFGKSMPHLAANPAIQFHAGDVRTFAFPPGDFSHVIHAAATSAVATFNKVDPQTTFDLVLEGTRHTLEFAAHCHAAKFLLTSSGSVYGRQPAGVTHVSEDHSGGPDPCDPALFLGESKRAAEMLCALYAGKYGIAATIARCFSFVGPYLPLDLHYAIGNFIRDARNNRPITVQGDGTPSRSYLYAADLAVWLWTILVKGESCRAYNVGSEEGLTIAELAQLVARIVPDPVDVRIAKQPVPGKEPDRYVPSTRRAQEELGLRQMVDLSTAIEKTMRFASGR